MKTALLTKFKAFVKGRSPMEAILHDGWRSCAIGEFYRLLHGHECPPFKVIDGFAQKVCFGVPALYELLNSFGESTVIDGELVVFSEPMELNSYGDLAAIIDDPVQASLDYLAELKD